jgi:daunorubicin resistance ABC transporter ATP-binding subunit
MLRGRWRGRTAKQAWPTPLPAGSTGAKADGAAGPQAGVAAPILTLRPSAVDGGSASTRGEALIIAEGVEKAFGSVVALAGVDLVVEQGTVLALLGRNGAGKSTLVRILSTLLRPDAGQASIAGLDVVRSAQRVRSLIGLAGQAAAVDATLTGRENLELVARLYGLGRREAQARAREALERLSLTAAGDRRVFTYSGGMRRRLDLGASLVGKPLVLIMDEPTTGLDPRTRLDLWKFVDDLVREGTTVLLTTQYLEEADRLADQIAVLERGRVVATGTAAELKQRIGGDVLELRARNAVDVERLRGLLMGLGAAEPVADMRWQRITLPTNDPINTLLAAAQRIQQSGIEVEDLGLRRPSLDDVFLTLTDSGEEPPAIHAAQRHGDDHDHGGTGA